MSAPGSLDNLQDAVEALEREGCVYVLVVGRPGSKCTLVYHDLKGNNDKETVETVLAAAKYGMEQEIAGK
jgi:hypothetical protein